MTTPEPWMHAHGGPYTPDELQRLPDGRPWHAAPRPGTEGNAARTELLRDPVFYTKHLFESAQRRLHPDFVLHDAIDRAETVRAAVEQTMALVKGVTRRGALTRRNTGRGRRPDPPSTNYLCGEVAQAWQPSGPAISVIIRHAWLVPPGPDEAAREPEVAQVNDELRRELRKELGIMYLKPQVNMGITLVVMGKAWLEILRGEPLGPEFATYLIRAGECFHVGEHCVYHEPWEIFGIDP